MKLEQQVTSLEVSKRLKELGVKQAHVLFRWLPNNHGEYEISQLTHVFKDKGQAFAAFTVAELGTLFPFNTNKKFHGEIAEFRMKTYRDVDGENWICEFPNLNYDDEMSCYSPSELCEEVFAPTEADARGKMLIYLLENGLIPNPKTV